LAAWFGGGLPGSKPKPTLFTPATIVSEPRSAEAAAQQPQGKTLEGTIQEILQVDRYTYLSLALDAGEPVWAAVPKTEVTVGQKVTVLSQQEMVDFRSETLKRTFARIHFGTLQNGEGAPAANMPPGHPPVGNLGEGMASGMNPHAGAMQPNPNEPPVAVGKVTPAAGANGRTIAALYAQRAQLSGKTATVRGVAVKVVTGVMGKNFVHIQDGTGSAEEHTNDLTLTTNSEVSRGSTILVTGAVATDKDFGAGYTYPVLLEDATVKAE